MELHSEQSKCKLILGQQTISMQFIKHRVIKRLQLSDSSLKCLPASSFHHQKRMQLNKCYYLCGPFSHEEKRIHTRHTHRSSKDEWVHVDCFQRNIKYFNFD